LLDASAPITEHLEETKEVPIENELSYILRLDFPEAALTGWEKSEIKQTYPFPKKSDFPRIRQEFFVESGLVEWTENIKTPAELCGEDYEDERYTTKQVFDIWWLITPQNDRLKKTRYTKRFGDELWCIDFFKNKAGETYLVKPEVEMPPGRKNHITKPSVIYAHGIYAVPRGNRDFASRKMANESKAKKGLNDLEQKLKNRPAALRVFNI
jgi:hypothetical protein